MTVKESVQRKKELQQLRLDDNLYYAVKKNDFNGVARFLSAGANPNARDRFGMGTALMHAATSGQVNVLDILIEAGAELEESTYSGSTALVMAARDGNIASVKRLIEAGANVNPVMEDGWGILFTACKNGLEECVRILVSAGSDVNLKSNDGMTAVAMSVIHNRPGCLNALIEAGADIENVRIKGRRLLDVAREKGWDQSVSIIEHRMLSERRRECPVDIGIGL